MPDLSELLAAYDTQVRDRVPEPLPHGVTVERDGPLLRFLGLAGRGFVVYRDLGGLEGAELDELIARQVEVLPSAANGSSGSCTGTISPTTCPSGCARRDSCQRRRRRS